jgi:hypothetical protein
MNVMRIQDTQIRAILEQMQRQSQTNVDDNKILEFLAGIGDRQGVDSSDLLGRLSQPGISRAEQFAIAKEGLEDHERQDIEKLLDNSNLQWSAGSRNFLEALSGRSELALQHGPLLLNPSQAEGIRGIAKEGDMIEAINLSTAPSGRLHLDNTTAIAEADRWGKFSGQLPDVQEGDIIRMRTRGRDGSISDWITIQAQGLGADTRNAQVNLERLDLEVQPNDQIKITHNTARPFTEPGALLRLTNLRTGETFDTKANDNGSLDGNFMLKGRAGDHFSIAASDGTNNTNFAEVAGVLKTAAATTTPGELVDLPDPTVLKSDLNSNGEPRYKLERFTGPLFIDGPSKEDIKQGAIGNCYFPSAMGSLAGTHPEVIQDMIKDNGDGTYTVRFYQNSYYGRPRAKEVTVDGDLFVRSYGGPVYGSSLGGSTKSDQMELWYPLIEKAYAQFKGGSYENIGNGGSAGDVMSAVLGGSPNYRSISSASPDRIYNLVKEAEDNKWPMAAGTYGKDRAELYTNSGIYAWHSYTVFGAEEVDGKRYIKLRNPWGQSEPGYDGKNDCIFRLPLEDFMKLYSGIDYVSQ